MERESRSKSGNAMDLVKLGLTFFFCAIWSNCVEVWTSGGGWLRWQVWPRQIRKRKKERVSKECTLGAPEESSMLKKS